MSTLVFCATAWGPKYGGLNAFNYDFCRALAAFGRVQQPAVRVVCLVLNATQDEEVSCQRDGITLVHISRECESDWRDEWAKTALERMHTILDQSESIDWWIGHDVKTGSIALRLKEVSSQGRCALVHHMSYKLYASYGDQSGIAAQEKMERQKLLFRRADYSFAVGPLLRDSLHDILDGDETRFSMVVPGMPEINPRRSVPHSFTAVMFGRLNPENDRIKQGRLAVAGFARAVKLAHDDKSRPDTLRRDVAMHLIGLGDDPAEEQDLRHLAEIHAERAIPLMAVPYMTDRERMLHLLGDASVALMPSWHEGFGLVGWEAIAAGVPLILSNKSGLHRLLEESLHEDGLSRVTTIDVRGHEDAAGQQNFRDDDLRDVAQAILNVAANQNEARRKAQALRERILDRYTWEDTCRDFLKSLKVPLRDEVPFATTFPTQPPQTAAPITVRPLDGILLTREKRWRVGFGLAESELLRAEEQCVPFHAVREKLLTDLLAWAQTGRLQIDTQQVFLPVAIQLRTGPAGAGKTRLMLEACRRLKEQGWDTGFLTSDPPNGWEKTLASECADGKNILCVIDYAETQPDRVVELAAAALALPTSAGRLRVVLLARHGGEWWERLAERDENARPLLAGEASTGPYEIPELKLEGAERDQVYQQAWDVFSSALGITNVPPVCPDLSAPYFGQVLQVHVKVLASLRGAQPESERGLIEWLVGRERRYWLHICDGNPTRADAFAHAVALVTLAGGTTSRRELEELVGRSQRFALDAKLKDDVCSRLLQHYPRSDRLASCDGLTPDILGERLAAQEITRDERILEPVLGKRAKATHRKSALMVLTRLSQHDSQETELLKDVLEIYLNRETGEAIIQIGPAVGEPLIRTFNAIFLEKGYAKQWSIAAPLVGNFPDKSDALSELAVAMSEAHHRHVVQKIPAPKSDADRDERTKAAFMLAHRMYEAGRLEDALRLGEEALRLQRQRRHEDKAAPGYLIGTLVNLSVVCAGLGRYEEAFEHAKQALGINRALAEQRPGVYSGNLAVSLSSFANRLGELGRYEEAFEHVKEALGICRALAEQRPGAYRGNLARLLSNFAATSANWADTRKHSSEERRRLAFAAPSSSNAPTPNAAISPRRSATLPTTSANWADTRKHSSTRRRRSASIAPSPSSAPMPTAAISLGRSLTSPATSAIRADTKRHSSRRRRRSASIAPSLSSAPMPTAVVSLCRSATSPGTSAIWADTRKQSSIRRKRSAFAAPSPHCASRRNVTL